jgi:hypothetical protein
VSENPVTYVDPLGLLRFKGCSLEDQQKITNGFKDYCSKIKSPDFASCMCDKPSIPGVLNRLCGDPNLTVRCELSDGGRCTGNCAWSFPLGRTIRLCPPALKGNCGPLGFSLMHEMTHQIGHTAETWPAKVEKCLGCQ